MSLKNFTRPVSFIALSLALAGLLLGISGHTVEARSGVVPIEIDPDSVIVAGQPTSLTITLNAAPADIRIYSQPSGVLAYQGTVNSATTTVVVPVNASAPSGPITVTVSTEGRTASATSSVSRLAPPAQ